MKKDILVFASGTKEGGGSGFRNLVEQSRCGTLLNGEIVGVVSNHPEGGVFRHAQELGIPFRHFPKPRDADAYRAICAQFKPHMVALSGWLHFVVGIRDTPVMNIHPGRLPDTARLHGDQVHERALELFQADPNYTTAVTLHMVPYQEEPNPDDYDTGKIIFEYPVEIKPDDTLKTLADRVNMWEHRMQPFVTNLVANGSITWNPRTNKLRTPPGYAALYLPAA